MSDEVSVTRTAQALGIEVGRSGSQFWLSPCPACGAARRHESRRDRRGAVSVTRDDAGWRCWTCGEHGKAASLAHYAGQPLRARPVAEPMPGLDYLDPAEARAFWTACGPARARRSVGTWLDGLRLEHAPCARSLPSGRLPTWGRGWGYSGHHLVLGLHDGDGRLRNVLARAVVPAERKSLAAFEVRRTELVLADRLGVALLTGRYRGPLVIVEGEKKLLISESLAEGRWATLGTGSGMWSDAIGAACTRASTCLVYTDPDEVGARYASAIARTLPGCRLRAEFESSRERVVLRPGQHEPDDDLHVAGGVPDYVREALT
jgi:hypothetical protein